MLPKCMYVWIGMKRLFTRLFVSSGELSLVKWFVFWSRNMCTFVYSFDGISAVTWNKAKLKSKKLVIGV